MPEGIFNPTESTVGYSPSALLAPSMKILITGGMGYIGSVMAREAIKKGYEVLIYDSLIYEQNTERMVGEIGPCNFVIGDTRHLELLSDAISIFKPDYVLHFAELSSVYACNHNPQYTEQINYFATINVLALCHQLGVKIIYNSTSSVYGTQKEMWECKEDSLIQEPTDYYVKNKLRVEQFIKENKLDNVIVFRPATVFGLSPRFRIELLPNHFTYMAVSRNVIPISGLDAYRAAIDVDELVEGYFKVMEKGSWNSQVYNIGHYNMSKRQFAEGIKKVVDCEIGYAPDIGDLRNLQIDCTKFNSEFDFHPSLSYEDSIRRVANWIGINRAKMESRNFTEMLNMPLDKWKQICQ